MINWARDMEDIIEETMSKLHLLKKIKMMNIFLKHQELCHNCLRNCSLGNGGYGADRVPLGTVQHG